MTYSDILDLEQVLKETGPFKERIEITQRILSELRRGTAREVQVNLACNGIEAYMNVTPAEAEKLSYFLISYLNRQRIELEAITPTLSRPHKKKDANDIFEETLKDFDLSNFMKKSIEDGVTRIGYMLPKMNAQFGLDLPEDELAFMQYLIKHYSIRLVWCAGVYIEMSDTCNIMKLK